VLLKANSDSQISMSFNHWDISMPTSSEITPSSAFANDPIADLSSTAASVASSSSAIEVPTAAPAQTNSTTSTVGQTRKKRVDKKDIYLDRPLSFATLKGKRGVAAMETFLIQQGVDPRQFTNIKRAEDLARECMRLQKEYQDHRIRAQQKQGKISSFNSSTMTKTWKQNSGAIDDGLCEIKVAKKRKLTESAGKRETSFEAAVSGDQSRVGAEIVIASKTKVAFETDVASAIDGTAGMVLRSPSSSHKSVENLSRSPAGESTEHSSEHRKATPSPQPQHPLLAKHVVSNELRTSSVIQQVEIKLRELVSYWKWNRETQKYNFNLGPARKACGSLADTGKELGSFNIKQGLLHDGQYNMMILTTDVQMTVLQIVDLMRSMLDHCDYGPEPTYHIRFVKRDASSRKEFRKLQEQYDKLRRSLATKVAEAVEWEEGLDGWDAAKYLVCGVFFNMN
jgi:hypothetical protein